MEGWGKINKHRKVISKTPKCYSVMLHDNCATSSFPFEPQFAGTENYTKSMEGQS